MYNTKPKKQSSVMFINIEPQPKEQSSVMFINIYNHQKEQSSLMIINQFPTINPKLSNLRNCI